MNFERIVLRNINESDVAQLHFLAEKCPPLDVHTHYTYWVICKFFSASSFLLSVENENVGYITAIETENIIFVWQIGILEQYRGQGYSHLLIDSVVDYAKRKQKNLAVTIAEENKVSFSAFNNYCVKNGLSFRPNGSLWLSDLNNVDFCEKEKIYDIVF